MIELTTLDTYKITGHGTMHCVEIPAEVNDRQNPRSLRGQTVLLDGRERVVAGVEAFAVPWWPGRRIHQNVALLLAD